MLSGLLLNVALYAVLRFKLLLAANAGAIAPGPLMATLGIVSLIFAAFMLYRRRDIKRLFAFSSIEHMGIIVFAFGMGGPLANFAGLLHMTMHSLTKSAIFFTVGHIAQAKGTQKIADIRGLTVSHPALGWSLSSASSPSPGCRRSAFSPASSWSSARPSRAQPWLAAAAGVRPAARLRRADPAPAGHGVRRAEPGRQSARRASSLPIAAHLGLVLVAGLYLPPPLVAWFQHVAAMLR